MNEYCVEIAEDYPTRVMRKYWAECPSVFVVDGAAG
jgi:hypothetical protein